MTVEIIEKGKHPKDRKYQHRCKQCKTLFRFNYADAQFYPNHQDGDYLSLPCPLCHSICSIAVWAEIKE